MKKQHRLRVPLAAVCGLLVLLVVAPVASANHISTTNSSADCTLVNNVPTVSFKIAFEQFDGNTKPVTGTVKLDSTVKSYTRNWEGPDYDLTGTFVTTPGSHAFAAAFTWPNQGGNNGKFAKTVSCPAPTAPHPGIDLQKTGAAYAYAGDTVTYYFAAKNTGDVTLTNPVITDPKCISAPVRADENGTSFVPGATWHFSCSYVVPAGVSAVDNLAQVCANMVQQPGTQVCDTDDHHFPVRTIAIAVDKEAVETTAVAGTTVHFTVKVTNTGNTAYVNYVYTDTACTPARTGANAADASFDPGDVWTYACAMATTVGQKSADNTFGATGTNSDERSATAQDSASVPLTAPPTTTPPGGGTPTPPGGGVLPETILSGQARLRGPSGCAKHAFAARLTGRSIATVAFYLDGKLFKRFSSKRASYTIKINPLRYGFGRHRVMANVTFVAQSGTAARTIRMTFRRCAQGAISPRFTG